MPDNEEFDDTQIAKNLKEVQKDIITLLKDLEYTYNLNPNNQRLHELKMKSSLANLEKIDSKLFHAYNALKLEDEDNLESNFGISVKLEIAKEKLNVLREKHNNLNKEWHSQDEHLNKISKQVCKKEEELKAQSILCTIQGLTFGKLLWKFSKNSKFLEIIVANEKLALEVIKIYSGCLYGFIYTFKNQLPDPMSNEYQFVLCLTGIFNNFATIPDGRFFLLHQPICREVLDQMIKTVLFISSPNGEYLKFLTLSTIYNIIICHEGLEFLKNNYCIMNALKHCINISSSERTILISLKIINTLIITNKRTFYKLDSPAKELIKLYQCNKSPSVCKHAKEILEALQGIHTKETIGTIDGLVKSKLRKQSCNGSERNVTCYVVSDKNVSNAFSSKNKATVSKVGKSLLGTSYSSSSSISSIIELSNYFPLSKCTDMSTSGSEQITLQEHKVSARRSKTIIVSNDLIPSSEKSVSCNLLELSQDNEQLILLDNLNSTESKEIQNVQFQFPYTNLAKTFSITVGDNLYNPRCMNRLPVRDAHHTEGEPINTSIVTVYRMNNSQMFAISDNSFFPLVRIPQIDAQTPTAICDGCLKVTQELTNIIDQDVENASTTLKNISNHELRKKYSILANSSSNEDLYEGFERKKCKKQQKKKCSNKKKRNNKSKIPVFKIIFRGRKKRI